MCHCVCGGLSSELTSHRSERDGKGGRIWSEGSAEAQDKFDKDIWAQSLTGQKRLESGVMASVE